MKGSDRTDRSDSHWFLIGYRAVGKTTVAQELSRRTRRPWIDLDAEIEPQLEGNISDFFATHGEATFRDVESQTLAKLLDAFDQPTILSLGGGAVLRQENRHLLKRHGRSIWLSATVATITERLAADAKTAGQRPSLTGLDVLDEVQKVLAVRTPIYRELADLTVAVDEATVAEVVDKILASLIASSSR